MDFSPAIDRRLVLSVSRSADLSSAAEVWRRLRRRAIRLDITWPCYESVRRLVNAERERRARLLAAVTTMAEILSRRVPVLPEHVPRIYARRYAQARMRMRARGSGRT